MNTTLVEYTTGDPDVDDLQVKMNPDHIFRYTRCGARCTAPVSRWAGSARRVVGGRDRRRQLIAGVSLRLCVQSAAGSAWRQAESL
jgi:hypothetical protein